jgi:hypothetical protein
VTESMGWEIRYNDRVMSKPLLVSVRLRRVTTETTFVSVPLLPDLVDPNFEESGSINVEKLMQAAVDLGRQPSVTWTPEEATITPHPVQAPPA